MFDRDKPYATVIETGRRAFLQDGVLYAPDGRRLSPPEPSVDHVDAAYLTADGGYVVVMRDDAEPNVGQLHLPAGWRNLPLTELRALAASLGITEKRKVGIIRAIQAMETA